MKVLYIGGQKSGKSSFAEKKALKLAKKQKPIYIATYQNSFNDNEMQKRIKRHQDVREKKFETIEATYDLHKILEDDKTYIIDCLSMLIFNHIDMDQNKIEKKIKKILKSDANIVFVLNEVGQGVIPFDQESRTFVDLSGIIGGIVAKNCDEVIRVDYGIETKIK
jgi:adenosylcobinamide kinase/adenosylcobinamide-phosphate guanylyltransferase